MKHSMGKFDKIITPFVWCDLRRCKACWKCMEACPKEVIGKVGFLWHKHIVIQNGKNCSGCKNVLKFVPMEFSMKSEQSGRKDFFFSKEAKVTVDILLVVGLIVAGIGSHMETAPGHYWQSAHCITGALWFLLVTVHVAQNWRMIKGFSRKKVIGKNRITFFTLIVFALMFISIVSFVGGLSFLFFHFFIGKLFTLTVFIHVIDKFKRLVRLCKNMG